MIIEKVYFNTEDSIELFGLLHKPEKVSNSVVVSVHGITSNCLKKRDNILAEEFTKNNIAYFSFDNRGSGVIRKFNKQINGKTASIYIGSVFEDVLDSYYDIKSAIIQMIKQGYTNIYLQGHSLGCLKVVYTYNKLKEENDKIINNIKSIMLLSMVDIQDFAKKTIQDFDKYYNIAIQKEKEKELDYVMSKESFISPLSVKTYLRYFKYNNDINFPRYSDEQYDYKEFNNIDVPIFMRWGNINECIVQDANELSHLVNSKILNDKKNIWVIDGANHSYNNKEVKLASEEIEFVKQIIY